MTSEVENLLVAALRLPAEARAALAAELIESLDPSETDEDAEAAWAVEIERRLADLDAGRVKSIPWPEARRRIHAAVLGHGKAD